MESVNDKKAANFYYQEVLRLYSAAYYGQRANARLNFINKAIADDYFRIKYYSHHFAKENTDSNQLADTFVSSAAIWDCPPPEQAIETAKQKGWLTFCELIYIKQYAEALAENNGTPPELIAWLQGKCDSLGWLLIPLHSVLRTSPAQFQTRLYYGNILFLGYTSKRLLLTVKIPKLLIRY